MNSPTVASSVSALAFLYEKAHEQCRWLRTLTPRQMQTLANLMMEWQRVNDHYETLPLEEIERREILRAVAFFGGNANQAARSLRIGKTTMYRKLRQWGYTMKNRLLLVQSSALGCPAEVKRPVHGTSVPSASGITRL
jgi:DNA-binding NtrC family response regulator